MNMVLPDAWLASQTLTAIWCLSFGTCINNKINSIGRYPFGLTQIQGVSNFRVCAISQLEYIPRKCSEVFVKSTCRLKDYTVIRLDGELYFCLLHVE